MSALPSVILLAFAWGLSAEPTRAQTVVEHYELALQPIGTAPEFFALPEGLEFGFHEYGGFNGATVIQPSGIVAVSRNVAENWLSLDLSQVVASTTTELCCWSGQRTLDIFFAADAATGATATLVYSAPPYRVWQIPVAEPFGGSTVTLWEYPGHLGILGGATESTVEGAISEIVLESRVVPEPGTSAPILGMLALYLIALGLRSPASG